MHPATKRVLDAARADIGMQEVPANSNRNAIVTWYNEHIAKIGAGPWCAMGTTHWMYEGKASAIMTGHALVDAFVRDGVNKHKGASWHWGLSGIAPGDLIVFDWSLPNHPDTRDLTQGDHIGIVERVGIEPGVVYTIEGNYRDQCMRVKRDRKYALGYVRFNWAALPGDLTPAPRPVPYPGHQHSDTTRDDSHVGLIQARLKKLGFYKGTVDNKFGPLTKRAVLAFQRSKRLEDDAWVGRNTWKALNITR